MLRKCKVRQSWRVRAGKGGYGSGPGMRGWHACVPAAVPISSAVGTRDFRGISLLWCSSSSLNAYHVSEFKSQTFPALSLQNPTLPQNNRNFQFAMHSSGHRYLDNTLFDAEIRSSTLTKPAQSPHSHSLSIQTPKKHQHSSTKAAPSHHKP